MLEGKRVSRISVRGFAVASATAVTTVGAVVGVASGNPQSSSDTLETAASDATLLAEIPLGQQAQVASLTEQADAQAAAADSAARKAAEESARLQAAENAKEKKAAAEAKAKAERKAEEKRKAERASREAARDVANMGGKSSYTVAEVQALARSIIPAGQFQCFSTIVQKESTWNYKAVNPSSGAYGLMQALPGSKMSSVGADWRTNPATQIKWGLKYMNERYGSPCEAWTFWQGNNWY
ncbi:transglycosylase SLT domain-containing protein [Streptomyces sp. CAU 1734]|uniref:aggregation-promoting factor C-terminal-like domain-containing protein n=1 Tax=Streptomyces sp. CAU 1734 TaxID=3140360 RepID=UPI0032619AAB